MHTTAASQPLGDTTPRMYKRARLLFPALPDGRARLAERAPTYLGTYLLTCLAQGTREGELDRDVCVCAARHQSSSAYEIGRVELRRVRLSVWLSAWFAPSTCLSNLVVASSSRRQVAAAAAAAAAVVAAVRTEWIGAGWLAGWAVVGQIHHAAYRLRESERMQKPKTEREGVVYSPRIVPVAMTSSSSSWAVMARVVVETHRPRATSHPLGQAKTKDSIAFDPSGPSSPVMTRVKLHGGGGGGVVTKERHFPGNGRTEREPFQENGGRDR
ncbi:hypothetical protein IWX90DRAFT_320947 [Phyllosticta citrichinensis]|uniref:Uncharacterized protein n=1 Tax=Phyllosticta citrichinensis TaxID=1130410 RepID=A0ABR1XJU3_9PEZI